MLDLALSILALCSTTPAAAPQALDVPSEVEAITKLRDDADPERIRTLAELRTREALEGLIEIYAAMNSVYMRRVVLLGVAEYDDVSDAETPAMELLRDVATEDTSRELREIAVDLLGRCRNFGRPYLRSIVTSPADPEVREQAMRILAGGPRPNETDWFRTVYAPPQPEPKKNRRQKDDEPREPEADRLGVLRELAFEVLVSELSLPELVEAAGSRNEAIQVRAIDELGIRGAPEAGELAEKAFENRRGKPSVRVAAARVLARDRGVEMAEEFIDVGMDRTTPEELSFGLAEIVAGFHDEDVDEQIVKRFGKGHDFEQLFTIRAARDLTDPKLEKQLIKLLDEKEPRVQREAVEDLGRRKSLEAVPALEKLLEKSKDDVLVAEILDALGGIFARDREWQERLVLLTRSERTELRNAAILQLGSTKNPAYLPVLVEALNHEQWSTRLVAARALETLQVPAGVGALCERIGKEEGRMAVELSDVLWRLTGQPFGANQKLWPAWWEREGATFAIIDASELRRREREREERRLKDVYSKPSSFFGIKIVSHRVVFVLDVSGSMNFLTHGTGEGQRGEPRIEVARRELAKCLASLEPGSFFNLIVFSDGVGSWLGGVSPAEPPAVTAAERFLLAINPSGGTNLFGGLAQALEDPDVDAIYLVSDGEPSVGQLVDPVAIREEIAAQNAKRGVEIHCIAIGEPLDILQWIAEDAGGSYVRFD